MAVNVNPVAAPKARWMTLKALRADLLPVHFNPVPQPAALRNALTNSGVRTKKANPAAARGGGEVYYNVADVEKWVAE